MMSGRDHVEDIDTDPECYGADSVRDILEFYLPKLRLHNQRNLILCSSCIKTLTILKNYMTRRTDCDLPDVKMPDDIDDFVKRCVKKYKLDRDSRPHMKMTDHGDGHQRKVKKRRSNAKPALHSRVTKKTRKNAGRAEAAKKKSLKSYSLETIMKKENVARDSTTDSINERLKDIEEYQRRIYEDYEDGSDN